MGCGRTTGASLVVKPNPNAGASLVVTAPLALQLQLFAVYPLLFNVFLSRTSDVPACTLLEVTLQY